MDYYFPHKLVRVARFRDPHQPQKVRFRRCVWAIGFKRFLVSLIRLRVGRGEVNGL